MKDKEQILKNRPAFHVDEHLLKAAKKAAKAFEEEEKELKKAEYERV